MPLLGSEGMAPASCWARTCAWCSWLRHSPKIGTSRRYRMPRSSASVSKLQFLRGSVLWTSDPCIIQGGRDLWIVTLPSSSLRSSCPPIATLPPRELCPRVCHSHGAVVAAPELWFPLLVPQAAHFATRAFEVLSVLSYQVSLVPITLHPFSQSLSTPASLNCGL